MQSATCFRIALVCTLALAACSPILHAQNDKPNPNDVPVVDGGIGNCSADFTIVDDNNSPVYDAKISVHIAYGTWSLHKMDLEVGTNAAGKARFTGLPKRTKRGLFFLASQGDRQGSAFDDPATTCKAQFTIQLQKKTQQTWCVDVDVARCKSGASARQVGFPGRAVLRPARGSLSVPLWPRWLTSCNVVRTHFVVGFRLLPLTAPSLAGSCTFARLRPHPRG